MAKLRVVKASDVQGFSPPGLEDAYISRLLVDSEGMGSERLQVVHATLKPGKTPGDGAAHPAPYDEAYYILRGQGVIEFDHGAERYEVGPDTAIFIPGGTWHRIRNTGERDLEFLTLWPLSPAEEGINGVYDARKRAWGTSFRLVEQGGEE